MHALVLLLAGGCAGADAPVDDTEAGAPVPYLDEEEDAPVAALTTGELEVAIDAALSVALSLNAAPIFPAYARATAGADASCPAVYDYEGNQYWYDACVATDGTDFSGYLFHQVYDDYDAGDGALYDGESLYGVAQVTTPEGYTFEAGGSAYVLTSTTESYTAYSSVIAGSYAWDGPEAEGTWLAGELSPDLAIAAYWTASGNLVQLDGGLSGLGEPVDTVVFDAAMIYAARLGSACPSEPGGAVSLRDAEGNWYDVLFDGPTAFDGEADEALCDGCGTAFVRGEELGAVCADFTGLLAFEGAPW